MTKKELEAIIGENQFTRIKGWPDNDLASLIEGIYYDGMADGYSVAIDRLQRLDIMPIEMAKQYRKKHEEQIKRIIDAIREYEKGHKKSRSETGVRDHSNKKNSSEDE